MRHAFNTRFLTVLISAAFLAACGGGGSGSTATPTVPTPPPQSTTVVIAGIATDDPIDGATVELSDTSGLVLETTLTNSTGQFSIQTERSAIEQGFQLVATGGKINGDDFLGELSAIYAASEDLSSSNLTPITTLIYRLATPPAASPSLNSRNAIIADLESIGVLAPDSWSNIELDSADLLAFRQSFADSGFDSTIDSLVTDLSDGDLTPQNLVFFPSAHGGLIAASVADDNIIPVFSGTNLDMQINVVAMDAASQFQYAKVSGPDWVTLSTSGVVSYDVPTTVVVPGTEIVQYEVENTATGLGRQYTFSISVLEGEQVLQAIVGLSGGIFYDDFGDISVDFPPGAVSVPANVTVTRGRDNAGDILIEVDVDGVLNLPYKIHLADDVVLETNDPDYTPQQSIAGLDGPVPLAAKSSQPTAQRFSNPGANSCIDELDPSYYLNNCWATYLGRYHILVGNWTRLPGSGTDGYGGFWDSVQIRQSVASLLQSNINWLDAINSSQDPVLLIHGFTPSASGMGGQSGTWGNFAELLDSQYLPIEFRWKTNARFQDVASDLSTAIESIARLTGKDVHIVAHSFGGVLTRALINDLASSSSNVSGSIASVTTLGSPHSGIFDTPDDLREVFAQSTWFPNGQDSHLFEFCKQLSCYQMGERVRFSDTESSLFDLDVEPGFIAASLADTYPPTDIPFQVLIGLTTDDGLFNTVVDNGDALISYEGQRMFPSLTVDSNSGVARNVADYLPLLNITGTQYRCNIRLLEKVLGYDGDARPGDIGLGKPPNWYGYRHSGGLPTFRGSAKEANINCTDSGSCLHDGWIQTANLLRQCQSISPQLPEITFNATVIDEQGAGISGVQLLFSRNSWAIDTTSQIFTNLSGAASAQLPFHPGSLYRVTAIPPANSGYRAVSLPSAIISGPDITSTDTTFPPIQLVLESAGRADIFGEIRDSQTNAPIAGAQYTLAHGSIPAIQGVAQDGTFQEVSLPAGTFVLTASAPGYLSDSSASCYLAGANITCSVSLSCATSDCQPDVTAPSVPTNVTALPASDTEILLSWSNSTDDVAVVAYDLYRDGAFLSSVPANITSATDDSALPATSYCFTVSARDAAGNESAQSSPATCVTTLSSPDTTPPSIPTGLAVTVDSATQISLVWNPSTDDTMVVGYNIYRDGVLQDTVSDLSFVDTGLTAATEYCYEISAVDAAGNESGQSVSTCATTESSTPLQITKILDSNTPLPGGDSLSCLGVPPIAIDQGRIAFEASGATGGPLFVVENDNIRRVADINTTMPGSFPQLAGFYDFDVDGQKIYFAGGYGVFAEEGGNITLIANGDTAAPSGHQFHFFMDVAADNGLVTFRSTLDPMSLTEGIFQFNGSDLRVIADPQTPDPARPGNMLSSFSDISSKQGLVTFGSSDTSGYSGLYVEDGNSLQTVANTDTSFPGGRDVFFSTRNTIDENGRILFNASDGNIGYPFYQWLMGSVSLAIDVPMTLSGTTTVLNIWKGYWASDPTRIVTQNLTEDGQGNSTIGLYLHQNDSTTKVIDTNDLLDGKVTYDLFPLGIDGDSLIFVPWFVDDSCGIFSIDLTP